LPSTGVFLTLFLFSDYYYGLYYFAQAFFFYIIFYHIIVYNVILYYIILSIPNDKFCRVPLTDTALVHYGVDDEDNDEADDD
jgi:hypothetical protein